MQLHKLIDKCVEYVALDGILGTEPLVLHQHLLKSDPSIDDAFFAYLYTVLVENPCIRVSITEEPIAAPDKTIRLGNAPLPEDYEVPDAIREDVDLNAMYLNGIKGRQLAFHLAGMEYKSNAEAVQARREVLKLNARTERSSALRKERDERKKLSQVSPEDGLIWDLEVDDGGGIAKEDLNGLAQQWGSRLRLRCTDQETYYRLTGSHTKNPKITPIVYQTLQHAAKSREKGITAVELGPLVGSSQGSMHHYMKVLTTLGLCAKVPTIIHAAMTNLLVFHAFLDQNENYRATKAGMAAAVPEAQLGVTGSVEADEADDPSIAPGPATASDWGLTFTELTEEQLMNGFIIRERLVKLLDHPSLTNHLLRAKNLLPLLGWKSDAGLRHRRSVPRAIRALIESGQVENVLVGERKIRCIRLTKYNPDRVSVSRVKPIEPKEPSTGLQDIGQLVRRYSQPTPIIHGVTSLQSIPYQIGEIIIQSGSEGLRIADIRDSLSGLFRRMVEFHFARYDKMTSPPVHLQHRQITSVMESHGRERRLRAFSMIAYRDLCARNKEPINDKTHPPTPPQAGHFAEISYLPFYADIKTFDKQLDKIGTPTKGVNIPEIKQAQSGAKGKRPRSASPDGNGPANVVNQTPAIIDQLAQVAPKPQKPQKRANKKDGYGQDAQVRGRPRKYIHVVLQDGQVERNIIGSILPHADLKPIWIYLPHLDKLVPACPSYSGIGPAPDPTEEELEQARSPELFLKFPRAKGTKPPYKNRRDALKKEAGFSTKRKEPTKDDGPGEGDAPRSKRPRPVKPVQEEIDELISDDDDIVLVEAIGTDSRTVDDASSAGPSGFGLEPNVASPQVASIPADQAEREAAVLNVTAKEATPVRADSFAELVDPAMFSDHFEAPPAIDDQTSGPDFDPQLTTMEDSPMPARAPSPVVAIIEPSAPQSTEVPPRVLASPQRESPSLQQPSPMPHRVSPPPRSVAHSPRQASPPPRQVPKAPTHAPTPPQRVVASPPRAIARESDSPPLREMSPPQPRYTAPQTPSHHYSPAPQPRYFTPPGVQSYTILPPVVYVPPGHTVWPPLPPGYPTTDVPPPHYQGGPATGPPPSMPGFWNHGQQQPQQQQYHGQQQPYQGQQQQEHQQQQQRFRGQQQQQQQPQYHGQHRSPYGSYSQQPVYHPDPGHMDSRSHQHAQGHPPIPQSQRGAAPDPATPGRGNLSIPIDTPGAGPSSPRARNGSDPRSRPSQTPVPSVTHPRNPISRLQSGEIGRQPISSPTPARTASSRPLGQTPQSSDQVAPVDDPRQPPASASPHPPVTPRDKSTRSSPAPVTSTLPSPVPAQPASPARPAEESSQNTPVPADDHLPSPAPDAMPSPVRSVPITPISKTSVPERTATPLLDAAADTGDDLVMDSSEPAAPVDSSQADITSSATLNSMELTPIRAPKKARKGRMDLGAMRRANEMLVVLQEAGGVYEEHALWRLHVDWVHRVAGTDVPHAPSVGVTMDRQVWKRLLQSTKDDGRTDDTMSSVPTSTAAWRTYRIVWLVDTPKAKIQEYMRGLANTVKKLTAPKPTVGTELPHMQYTEVKLPSRHPSSTVQHHLSEVIDTECRRLTGDERRNALCKDPLVLSQLYGRQSGKWARTSLFHLSVRSAVQNDDSPLVMDSAAGVFSSPMMTQDIPIGAFYSVVMTHEKDEALLEWLKSPINRAVPVKDVPYDIRITHGGRRQRTQVRIREHVQLLLALGLISPLSNCTEAEAYVTVNTPQMPHAPLKIDDKQAQGEVTTYVIHDWAPVYHIAATIPVLLGYLPVRTEEEINKFWEGYKLACREILQHRLPEFTPRSAIESRNIADSPEVIRISNSWRQTLRQPSRWVNHVRLLPVQRDALNETVNWTEATSNIQSDDQLKALAWEFALPEEAVRQHYQMRLQKAIEAKSNREKRTRAMDEALSARHVKAQRALAFKLSERQAQSKRAWEERVARICANLMVQFDHQLLDHVSRQSLTSMTKGFLTDEMIERIIRQYFSHRLIQSVKDNVPPPNMPLQAIPVVRAKGPKELAKRDTGYKTPGTRYRRKWTAEDDEKLMDAEAIIRARNRDRTHNQRTRLGIERLFAGSLLSSCTFRVKKIVNTPEKEAYLELLADAWYELWTKYRETEELNDDNPEHNLDFDIQEHVDFLRKHVNKTELRVEAQVRGLSGSKKEPAPELPDSLTKVMGEYRWQYPRISRPQFEMLWQNNNSQDARMGEIGSLSTLELEKRETKRTVPDLARHRLRAILKMIIATNPSEYAQPAAIALLQDYDQAAAVNPEIIKMQQEKILVRHSSASSTGRFYSFASAWDTLRLGHFTEEFYQDAARLEDKLSTPSGIEWPVVGSSGELAALMNMVSDQSVDFQFDSQDFPTVIGGLGLQNTRRLTDVSFEFGINVKKVADPAPVVDPPSLYYCPAPRRWQADSPDADLSRLYVEVGKAGPDGISKPDLQAALGVSRDELHRLLVALSNDTIRPVTFWAGYDTARLVSKSFWSEWQCPARQFKLDIDGRVNPEGEGVIRCTPRIWVDIWGRRLEQKWKEAVASAKGWLVSRPGMSERIFREKLGMVMDRLEVNDVLQFVLDKGTARRVWLDGRESAVPPVEAVDVDEEEIIIWRPEPKRLLA